MVMVSVLIRHNGQGRGKAIFITRKLFPKLSFTFILKNEDFLFSKLLGLRFNFSNALNINGILSFSSVISTLITLKLKMFELLLNQ